MALPYDLDESGLVLSSGARLKVSSGAYVNFESGGQFQIVGTAVLANAAELNSLDDINTSWPTLLTAIGGPTYTIGGEAANIINVAAQLKDVKGVNFAARRCVTVFLSDDEQADGITATAPDALAIGTNGTIIVEHVTDKFMTIMTDVLGRFDINITYAAGAKTWYLCVVYGSVPFPSAAITFA